MLSEAGIADCRVSECDRKTVPRCGTRNRKCSTAVCGQSVTWDHKCVLLSRPVALPWHDSADWDDMLQQIVRCKAVQTPMNSDYQLECNSVRNASASFKSFLTKSLHSFLWKVDADTLERGAISQCIGLSVTICRCSKYWQLTLIHWVTGY